MDFCGAQARAVAFKADQGDPSQVEVLIEDVVTKLGRLDILVNDAGLFAAGPVDAMSDTKSFDRMYAVNVTGVIAGIRAASRIMKDSGRIISMSSAIPTRVGAPGLADYAASKAAVEGYNKGAARDLGPRGITVNVIAVGSAATDMNPDDGPFAALQKAANALGRHACASGRDRGGRRLPCEPASVVRNGVGPRGRRRLRRLSAANGVT